MGIFDQIKAAQEMMKNMSPDQISALMKQAQESKKMMDETIRRGVEEEIKNRGLVTREEVEQMIRENRS